MKRVLLSTLVAAAVAAGVSFIIVNNSVEKLEEKEAAVTEIRNKQPVHYRATGGEALSGTGFCDAAEMAVNSVVYVKVVKKAKVQSPSSVLDLIFGFQSTPKDQVGLGSGVIIDEAGYIVTNNHVVAGADEVAVTTYDNRTFDAEIIGTDEATDLALLKISASDLQPIAMGDSDEVRLGEWVLAIGSPYDLRSTITAGIVSAKGRAFPNYTGAYRVESFIQTDAAVNPGNSGGALVNTSGELVGINTSIVSLTGSYAGYSFAVPVNIVRKIADDFITYGEVRRAVLGISMTESEEGVIVADVKSGTPAAEAGIKAGDVLLEINLNKTPTAASVQEQVSKLRPGEKAVVTLRREGVQKEIMVNL